MLDLTPEKALIFRITHIDNVTWLLKNGIHCRNSESFDPAFVNIGNPDLIEKRRTREIPLPPGGMLSDYVPFYFTPHSPMLYNIRTGFNGITRRSNSEIVIVVSSLRLLAEKEIPFLFTDRHASLVTAEFFDDLGMLGSLDWRILQARDFKRDNDLGKIERYQAEALVHKRVNTDNLLGIACSDSKVYSRLEAMVAEASAEVKVVVRPGWYFS
jgi:hypothetical protein